MGADDTQQPNRARLPRPLRIAIGLVLLANALDLTTSLLPTAIDTVRATPARSTIALVAQLALLAPALRWLARRARQGKRWFDSLPIPLAARWVCALVVSVEIAHIALRTERYPFTPVAMFSTAVTEPGDTATDRVYVIVRDGKPEVLSFMREGSPFFSRYIDVDYKAGWLLRMYAPGSSSAYGWVRDRLADAHAPAPFIADVVYRRSDGVIVAARRRYP
jgi:hypothetical protein